MITVSILINGEAILTRTAVNKGQAKNSIFSKYHLDSGNTILHKREDGAIKLAKMMLDDIKECSITNTINNKPR